MKEKFKKLFYRWAYLDFTENYKKEDTYFYRFSKEIAQNNLRMMQSMSIFMLIISLFVIASTYTYFGEESLRSIYITIVFLEIVLISIIQILLKHQLSTKFSTILTSLHLFHMLAISGYISVIFCRKETALLFVVVLTISSMIFTLPTMLSMCISTISTFALIIASYYIKESYWFESDALNGVSVLIFSFLFGWRFNCVRAEEAFARADAQNLNQELQKLSITDQLTGLYNHRKFQDTYYNMFHLARTNHLPLGILMMDLDKFKSYNDNYGHVAGDECLQNIANAIASSVPSEAIACRYGGEEFIVLLNENLCNSIDIIGEDIRKSVAALKIPHAFSSLESDIVTLSLGGYTGIPSENEKPMNFVDCADKAMYQSKTSGRNRLTICKKENS